MLVKCLTNLGDCVIMESAMSAPAKEPDGKFLLKGFGHNSTPFSNACRVGAGCVHRISQRAMVGLHSQKEYGAPSSGNQESRGARTEAGRQARSEEDETQHGDHWSPVSARRPMTGPFA
jgi:hypothetical protein